MTGSERAERHAEVEAVLEVLVECGWCVERLASEDEEGEPYRVEITLRVDNASELGGTL